MKLLAVVWALAGCATTEVTMVRMDNATYPMCRVAAESLNPTRPPVSVTQADGSVVAALVDPSVIWAEPALCIVGTPDPDTAIRVMAKFCDRPYAEVADYGAYGDPVWTDPATGQVVFWLEC